MKDSELIKLLDELLAQKSEQSWLEFKTNVAIKGASLTPEGIGEYISALSNGATISNKNFGYLVLGIQDDTARVTGTNFYPFKYKIGNQDFELWLRNLIYPKINFEIFEFEYDELHLVMFRIPSAKGEPVNFQKKPYIRINSQKTDLRNYPALVRQIYNALEDWSARKIEAASVSDLDEQAILLAREKFKSKNVNESFYEEIDNWDVPTFLDKAKITIEGKITNTALILLGKNESSHYLLPSVAEITWKLDTDERAYEHFTIPFLLSTKKFLQKIRNYQYKFFPDNQLLSVSVNKYETKVILEAMNNAIAHQDYSLNSRVIVLEKTNKLVFTNAGNFFSCYPEYYFFGDKTPDKYRNPWLVKAMVNLGMIDTVGNGIYTMIIEQKKRYFPLPEYSNSESNKVVLEIYGHEIDINYSKLLIENKNLELKTVVLLDKIQKKLPISKEESALLKRYMLIEGRYPNCYISASVASITGNKAQYIKDKSFDDKYFKDLIVEYLKKFKKASKHEIDQLLLDKLPDGLDKLKRKNKIRNLVYALSKKEKIIENQGTRRYPVWILKNNFR
jgi:ATP-dependent DNA helicase RecG